MRQRNFHGWTVLAGAMLAYFCMCGNIFYAYGVFLPSMCDGLGWSRSAMSGPYTLNMLVGGFLGPLAGISITKFGARKNIVLGNLVSALGLLGMSTITEVYHVYIFFGVLIGAGQAFGAWIATIATVNNWFVRRRSLAMSLLFTSGGIGGFAFPPLISWLISSLEWRFAWVCLGGIHLVLAVVIAGMLVRNKPEDIGQVPDGEVAVIPQKGDTVSPVQNRVYQTPADWTVGAALRSRALWLVMAFGLANMFTLNMLSIHQVSYVQDLGFSHMTASTAFGLLVGMSIIGRLACGVLGTRFEGRHLAAVCLAGFTVGIVILMNVTSLPFIYLYAIVSGISYGGIIVLEPALLGAYFGRAHYAQIMGWVAPIGTLVGASSPLLGGLIYDITESYIPAFVVAAVFLGVGVVCALLARPPKELAANY